MNGTVLVRAPSSRLAEGIVTHISRTAVDVARARVQHAAYAEALTASGWILREAPSAEDCPDSVFIEDTVVVCEDLAVLTRPGAAARRAEVAGVAGVVRSLGLRTAEIREPGTLDGGDVLQAGLTVYVGHGGRTNGAGIRQLRALLAPLGRTVIAVPLGNVLHLKSAVTALPDGTFLLLPHLVPGGLFPAVRPVDEEGGCHVVPLGGDQVLIAASAPRTAQLIDDLGFTPVVVDISEFEKLEGCVTCLSVLLPGRLRPGGCYLAPGIGQARGVQHDRGGLAGSGVAVRPATVADAGFCYELHKAAMGEYVTAVWGWDEQVQRAFHQRAFNPDRWQIITAGQAGIGMLDVEYRPREIYLARIEIDPGHQGQGIGTRIISALLDEAERTGRDLTLEVLTVNRRARALYRRLGLTEVARHRDRGIKISMRSARHRE